METDGWTSTREWLDKNAKFAREHPVVSEAQQAAIDVRQRYVARYLVGGLTLREIQAKIAALSVVDPATGAKVPVCRNPDTGKAWSLGTIGEDAQFLREGWKAGVSRQVAERIALVDAHLAEMRRLAYAANDLKALLAALKQECKLFGLNAPKQRGPKQSAR